MNEFSDILQIPGTAGSKVRKHLGLSTSDALRVAFIPGPGDVAGTFQHWRAQQHEPRVPIIAYSLMFYELMDRLDAHSLIISLESVAAARESMSDRFHFQQIVPRPATGRWSYFWSQYQFAKSINAIVGDYDPHVVVTSTHNPALSWPRLAKNRKLVLTAHNSFWPQGSEPTGLKARLRKALLSSHARALDAAICTSHECARQVALLTDGRIQADVECPQIVSRYPIEERTDVRNLLFLGRVERPKGVFLLLDVFEQITQQYPSLRLTIAGDGDAAPELRHRLLTSSLSQKVSFLGRVDSQGVHAAIAASDLVVCPTMTSFNEGLAVVGFEAAAHGIPTILSSVVPASHLLSDSCTMYQADDPASLRQALCGLIDNPHAYREKCAATAGARDMIYDRTLSWGSGLFRAIMNS
jgi:glycogen(starch) synthase